MATLALKMLTAKGADNRQIADIAFLFLPQFARRCRSLASRAGITVTLANIPYAHGGG